MTDTPNGTWALPPTTPADVREAIAQAGEVASGVRATPSEVEQVMREANAAQTWLVPHESSVYGLPRRRTLHGMPYGAAPVLLELPVGPPADLDERAADLERYLALVADGNTGPAAPPDPLSFDRPASSFRYGALALGMSLLEMMKAGPRAVEGFFENGVFSGSMPLPPGLLSVSDGAFELELEPPRKTREQRAAEYAEEMRHFEADPGWPFGNVTLAWLRPAGAGGEPWQRMTLAEIALRILEVGLDDSDEGPPVWVDADGYTIVRIYLKDGEDIDHPVVGPLDITPDDWAWTEAQPVYEGPMYRRAQRLVTLLLDTSACLGLANGRTPNLDEPP